MTHSKVFISTLTLCIFSLLALGQDQIKNYVQSSSIQISTIDPTSTEYSNLEDIGKAIANSTIVMLGEQDHGDATTFFAKTRLIKYLHEKKGFDVIAFESDFFSLNEGWKRLKKDKNEIQSFLRLNIYPIWSHCDACSTLLYQYLPNTYNSSHPLEVTGFDSDLVLDYSSKNLIENLDSIVRRLDLPIVNSNTYATCILPVLDSLKYGFSSTLNDNFYTRSFNYLQEIKRQMACKLSTDDFWMQVVNNLINANINHGVRDIDVIRSFNARDSQMAQNLNWLRLVKFPGKKIIVWAANTHVGKQADTLMKNKSGQSFTSMGSFFTRDSLMLNQTYVLGFTSFNGKAGRLTSNEYTIPTPSPNTFESWIDTSFQYAFIDFRTFNKQYPNADNPFYLKGFLHYPEKENWTKVFDGIFYIKDMYPCNR